MMEIPRILTPVTAAKFVVCRHYGLPPEAMTSQCRDRSMARPRQMAIAIVHRISSRHSIRMIGRDFGGRHHTTVLYAFKALEQRLAADDGERALFDALTAQARDLGLPTFIRHGCHEKPVFRARRKAICVS